MAELAMPYQLWLGKQNMKLLSEITQVNSSKWFAEYGKPPSEGNWSVRVYLEDGEFFIADSDRHDCYIPKHLEGRQLYKNRKENKMSRFDNGAVAQTIQTVKDETVDVAQITIGKLIYTNGGEIVSRLVPKLKWYEKLFTSSKKRELALLVGTYVAIKLVQNRYDHYLLQSVSAYINFQLQTELLGGVTQDTLDKLFSKFESVT